jgi:hypothetical protein
MNTEPQICKGFCVRCNRDHSLGAGNARDHAVQLMDEMERKGRIDLAVDDADADPALSTDYLYTKALGQMFAVLECKDDAGETVVLKAFSGQYNSYWHVEGWEHAPFDLERYERIVTPGENEIKDLGRQIDGVTDGSEEHALLSRKRKHMSQDLMMVIHGMYELHNFNNETASLEDAFIVNKGLSSGTGACCAPKLLNQAARRGLTPVGIAEFFFGQTNRSQTRQHRQFYPSCEEKCQPILGFMLCGLDA